MLEYLQLLFARTIDPVLGFNATAIRSRCLGQLLLIEQHAVAEPCFVAADPDVRTPNSSCPIGYRTMPRMARSNCWPDKAPTACSGRRQACCTVSRPALLSAQMMLQNTGLAQDRGRLRSTRVPRH